MNQTVSETTPTPTSVTTSNQYNPTVTGVEAIKDSKPSFKGDSSDSFLIVDSGDGVLINALADTAPPVTVVVGKTITCDSLRPAHEQHHLACCHHKTPTSEAFLCCNGTVSSSDLVASPSLTIAEPKPKEAINISLKNIDETGLTQRGSLPSSSIDGPSTAGVSSYVDTGVHVDIKGEETVVRSLVLQKKTDRKISPRYWCHESTGHTEHRTRKKKIQATEEDRRALSVEGVPEINKSPLSNSAIDHLTSVTSNNPPVSVHRETCPSSKLKDIFERTERLIPSENSSSNPSQMSSNFNEPPSECNFNSQTFTGPSNAKILPVPVALPSDAETHLSSLTHNADPSFISSLTYGATMQLSPIPVAPPRHPRGRFDRKKLPRMKKDSSTSTLDLMEPPSFKLLSTGFLKCLPKVSREGIKDEKNLNKDNARKINASTASMEATCLASLFLPPKTNDDQQERQQESSYAKFDNFFPDSPSVSPRLTSLSSGSMITATASGGEGTDLFEDVEFTVSELNPKVLVGTYQQRTIPFRSASFSQIDIGIDGTYSRRPKTPIRSAAFNFDQDISNSLPFSSVLPLSATLPRRKISERLKIKRPIQDELLAPSLIHPQLIDKEVEASDENLEAIPTSSHCLHCSVIDANAMKSAEVDPITSQKAYANRSSPERLNPHRNGKGNYEEKDSVESKGMAKLSVNEKLSDPCSEAIYMSDYESTEISVRADIRLPGNLSSTFEHHSDMSCLKSETLCQPCPETSFVSPFPRTSKIINRSVFLRMNSMEGMDEKYAPKVDCKDSCSFNRGPDDRYYDLMPQKVTNQHTHSMCPNKSHTSVNVSGKRSELVFEGKCDSEPTLTSSVNEGSKDTPLLKSDPMGNEPELLTIKHFPEASLPLQPPRPLERINSKRKRKTTPLVKTDALILADKSYTINPSLTPANFGSATYTSAKEVITKSLLDNSTEVSVNRCLAGSHLALSESLPSEPAIDLTSSSPTIKHHNNPSPQVCLERATTSPDTMRSKGHSLPLTFNEVNRCEVHVVDEMHHVPVTLTNQLLGNDEEKRAYESDVDSGKMKILGNNLLLEHKFRSLTDTEKRVSERSVSSITPEVAEATATFKSPDIIIALDSPRNISPPPSMKNVSTLQAKQDDPRISSEKCLQHKTPQAPKRYGTLKRRPLRGPYGEMLEAEMNKSGFSKIYSKRSEDLSFLREPCLRKERDVKSSSPRRPISPIGLPSNVDRSPIISSSTSHFPIAAMNVNVRQNSLPLPSSTSHSLDDSQLKVGYNYSSTMPLFTIASSQPNRIVAPKRKTSANIPYVFSESDLEATGVNENERNICDTSTASKLTPIEGTEKTSLTSASVNSTDRRMFGVSKNIHQRTASSPYMYTEGGFTSEDEPELLELTSLTALSRSTDKLPEEKSEPSTTTECTNRVSITSSGFSTRQRVSLEINSAL